MLKRCTYVALGLALAPFPVRAEFDAGLQAMGRHDGAAAYREFLPLAQAGEADAEYVVGRVLELGEGVPKDLAGAAQWFRRAAEHGLLSGMLAYGQSLVSGHGVPQDRATGTQWITKAAEGGHVSAQVELGGLFLKGNGVPRNVAKARDWLLRAAQGGSGRGMFDLAMLSFSPTEGVADEALGREWLGKAVQSGFAPARAQLAVFVLKGEHGWTIDPAAAFELARSAAQRGNALAETTLGDLYREGRGAPQSDAEAALWYERASRHGSGWAQYHFATMRLAGRGTARDPADAYFWASVAETIAPERDKPVVTALRLQAARELTPARQQELRQRAVAWQPQP